MGDCVCLLDSQGSRDYNLDFSGLLEDQKKWFFNLMETRSSRNCRMFSAGLGACVRRGATQEAHYLSGRNRQTLPTKQLVLVHTSDRGTWRICSVLWLPLDSQSLGHLRPRFPTVLTCCLFSRPLWTPRGYRCSHRLCCKEQSPSGRARPGAACSLHGGLRQGPRSGQRANVKT